MIEVIYLISRARPSGPINQALNILTGMKQNGRVHAVLVTLAPEEKDNSWLQRFCDNGIEVVQFLQPLKSTWRCIKMLRQYVEEHHVDVIHSAGYRADTVSLLTKCSAKKISTQRCLPNEIAEKLPKFTRPFWEYAHLKMIKRMDAVVACSKSLQKVFVNDYHVGAIAVQNGVNTDYFVPLENVQKREMREKLGLPIDKRIYLVLGRLSERKNIGFIIDVFKSIQKKEILLLIVGNGPLEEELREKAKSDKRVVFTGNSTTPLLYLQTSDFLISSALAEGLPNTVLEALACGLPSILSDIEPHKEIIEGTNAGMLFKNNDKKELVSCILSSLNWNMKEKSEESRRIADGNFAINSLAANYEDVYKRIL